MGIPIASEHPVLVGRGGGNLLSDIPEFGNPVAFKPEEVHDSSPGFAFGVLDV